MSRPARTRKPPPRAETSESRSLARRQPEGLARAAELAENVARADELAKKADSENTRRAYGHDIKAWTVYAEANRARACPADPQLVLGIIGALDKEGASVAKIKRRLAAISRLHRDAGVSSPTADPRVRLTMAGLVREREELPHKKRPLTGDMIALAFGNADFKFDTMERALVTVGIVSGMRRSEIVALRSSDLEEYPDGFVIRIRKSKTDKKKKGAVAGVPYGPEADLCPVRLLKAWLKSVDGKNARLFPVVADTVNNLVKRIAEAAGEDPKEFGAHSLRAGMATASSSAGVAITEQMQAGRWSSHDTARGYARSEALRNKAHLAAADSLRRRTS